jgi:hypothetical protein
MAKHQRKSAPFGCLFGCRLWRKSSIANTSGAPVHMIKLTQEREIAPFVRFVMPAERCPLSPCLFHRVDGIIDKSDNGIQSVMNVALLLRT